MLFFDHDFLQCPCKYFITLQLSLLLVHAYYISGVVYYYNFTLVGTHDSHLICIVLAYRQKIDSQSSQIGFFFCGSCLLEPPPSATCYLETFSNAGIVYEHITLILSMNIQAE